MDKMIYTAMSGASQTLARQAAVANNLANLSSAGYRSEEQRLVAVPIQSDALPTRAFAVDTSAHIDFTPGPMQSTGRALDVAVQGPGWLVLSMPDGSEAFTRNGSLEVSANGVLQSRSGLPVQGEGGSISIPPDVKITVAKDGTVSVIPQTDAQTSVNAVGRLKLVNPPEADLVRGNDGLFRLAGGASADSDPSVVLASGFLEGSNVNAIDQMVTMISLAREFDMQMKNLTNAQSNDQAATQVISNL